MHASMHHVWQTSEPILPNVGKIYPVKPVVTNAINDFMPMATSQVAGLQEASGEIEGHGAPVHRRCAAVLDMPLSVRSC
eukprot:3439480-Pyramimonas_sp.AAC.1